MSALGDLKVLELTDAKGEYCGKLLADMGADVVRIEPPGGSPTRRIGPFVKDVPHPERSLHFWQYNTNKRSITLNLETQEGRGIFRRLIAAADVLVESCDPGYLDELGLSAATLQSLNPRLIWASIAPFGQTGPHRDYKGSDLIGLAMGGPLWSCGYDDHTIPPMRGGGGQGYHTGCHYACIGILLALVYRDRTGQGQHIDASIQEALACCNHTGTVPYLYEGVVTKRQTGNLAAATKSPPLQFRCKDGRYAVLRFPRGDMVQWRKLVQWMEKAGQLGDLDPTRYKTPADLERDMGHIMEVFGRFASQHTAQELFHEGQRLEMWGWGIVTAPHELLASPQLNARGFFVEVEHPELGRSFTYPGAPYHFSRTPWAIRRHAPSIGEHNAAVYEEELGLSRSQTIALYEAGVI